jgi:hypothetical protein
MRAVGICFHISCHHSRILRLNPWNKIRKISGEKLPFACIIGIKPIQEAPMGLFESNPLVMIVVIILTVEGWSLLKKSIRGLLARRDLRTDIPRHK